MLGYAAKKKADLDNEINKLTKHISTLEKKHKTQINGRTLTELQELKLKLDTLLLKKANDITPTNLIIFLLINLVNT